MDRPFSGTSARSAELEVFVANADGSNEVNLSKNAAFDGWPVWSPDGQRIAFSSNRAGPANTGQIFVLNVDGSGLRQLTSGPGGFAQPSWSWDGRRIVAYQNWETAEYQVREYLGDRVQLKLNDCRRGQRIALLAQQLLACVLEPFTMRQNQPRFELRFALQRRKRACSPVHLASPSILKNGKKRQDSAIDFRVLMRAC